MTLYELLYCSAEAKMIVKSSKFKDIQDVEINSMITMTTKKVEADLQCLKTTDEIYTFLLLYYTLNTQKLVKISEKLFYEVFNIALDRIDEFELHQLGKLTTIASVFYEEAFEKIKWNLIKKFEEITDFQAINFNSLMWIWRGLSSKTLVLPKNINLFYKVVYFHICSINQANYTFNYAAEISEKVENSLYPIKELIGQKLAFFFQRDSAYFGIPEKQNLAYFMMQSIASIDNIEVSTDLCLKIANKFFIFYNFKNMPRSNIRVNKKRIFRTYLLFLERIKVCHTVYFEIIVNVLESIFNDVKSKLIVTYMMPCFYCLTYLGFGDYIKGKHVNIKTKISWDSLIQKMSNSITLPGFDEFFNKGDDVEVKKYDRKIIILNYLWSLAYLNIYNKEELKILLKSDYFNDIRPEDRDDFVKLYQINAWLKKTDPKGPQLEGLNKTKMELFKKIFDASDVKAGKTALHTVIKSKIDENSLSFIENYKNFQYFFDFADVEQKIGIIIDRENTLVKIDDKLELDRVQVMADSMAKAEGWTIHRLISHENEDEENVKVDYSKIFSK